jgi:hypothetical protein
VKIFKITITLFWHPEKASQEDVRVNRRIYGRFSSQFDKAGIEAWEQACEEAKEGASMEAN